ncbi:MAG: FHA domain-containing protein [Verrucomicrobiota bacterium]
MATLVFYLDETTSMTHALEPGTTTVGRHPDSIIVLDFPSVSGHHAVIELQDDGCLVIDQQSSNGTRINGADIEESMLQDGDRVAFGDVQAVYYEGDAPGEEGDLPQVAAVPEIFVPVPEIPRKDAPPPAAPADYRKVNKPPAKPRAVRRMTGYPSTAESGCVTALIVIGLFFAAFAAGLFMRHYKETEGANLFSDLMEKISSQVPKIKIEK